MSGKNPTNFFFVENLVDHVKSIYKTFPDFQTLVLDNNLLIDVSSRLLEPVDLTDKPSIYVSWVGSVLQYTHAAERVITTIQDLNDNVSQETLIFEETIQSIPVPMGPVFNIVQGGFAGGLNDRRSQTGVMPKIFVAATDVVKYGNQT